ncbi:MAG: isoprenylcysteine carboxylmethyltransferase family protein [Candidatus Kariarchaeaceae archaeon]|jgi:protein-S-isoprenylcysteine O-methyltransferase Ste14
MDELVYKILLAILLGFFTISKIQQTGKYVKTEEEGNKYPFYINSILAIGTIGIFSLPILYILGILNDFDMKLPDYLRIAGIVGFAGIILFIFWVMQTLGLNISTIHQDRYLVTNGPYRYIRHPLYFSFCMISIFEWVISANWILAVNIPFVVVAMLLRIRWEERILFGEYGEMYQKYSQKSWKLFPLIF